MTMLFAFFHRPDPTEVSELQTTHSPTTTAEKDSMKSPGTPKRLKSPATAHRTPEPKKTKSVETPFEVPCPKGCGFIARKANGLHLHTQACDGSPWLIQQKEKARVSRSKALSAQKKVAPDQSQIKFAPIPSSPLSQ
jgi:hypothetical protein